MSRNTVRGLGAPAQPDVHNYVVAPVRVGKQLSSLSSFVLSTPFRLLEVASEISWATFMVAKSGTSRVREV